jgi:hypothetical protein
LRRRPRAIHSDPTVSRRWVRFVVALATTLAAWVVAMPARAAAPLCDYRGATTFAPAPQLQSPETSIDVSDADDDGCLEGLRALCALQEGNAPSPVPAAAPAFEATLPIAIAIAPATDARAPAPRPEPPLLRPGVRGRVDRPPRSLSAH